MSAHQTHAASALLGRMLFGISETSPSPLGSDEPDFSGSEIREEEPGVVSAKLHMPTGDTFQVTVAWISEESP